MGVSGDGSHGSDERTTCQQLLVSYSILISSSASIRQGPCPPSMKSVRRECPLVQVQSFLAMDGLYPAGVLITSKAAGERRGQDFQPHSHREG
jgi:hypothetical protein